MPIVLKELKQTEEKHVMKNGTIKNPFAKSVVLAALVGALWCLASSRTEAGQFGTRCQETFQNGWRKTLPHANELCDDFVAELNDTDTSLFYFTLKWGESGFSSDADDGLVNKGGVDAVDLFYVNTHGGEASSTTDARLAMWQEGLRTFSSTWRFGNNSDQVAIFSQYACETLRVDDFSFNRWDEAFRGGLLLATGSHDKLYDSVTTEEAGEDYADDLQSGKSVKWAWFDGNADWNADQDVAIKASSTGSLSQCRNRRDTITWQNFGSVARIRDNNMKRICSAWIDDYD